MSNSMIRQKGFTLIELLLYISLVGGLLLAVSLFFNVTVEARVKNQTINEVDQQGTILMDDITRIIRNADSISAPAPGATAASLTLVVPTASLSPTIFSLNGTTMRIKDGGGPTTDISNTLVAVTNLEFTNLTRSGTPGIVQVSFTLSRVNASGRAMNNYEKTFTSSAALRQP